MKDNHISRDDFEKKKTVRARFTGPLNLLGLDVFQKINLNCTLIDNAFRVTGVIPFSQEARGERCLIEFKLKWHVLTFTDQVVI